MLKLSPRAEARSKQTPVRWKKTASLLQVTAVIALSLAGLQAREARAAEGWTCTQIIGGKPFVYKYVVNGDILVHNGGKGKSTIIENNSDHLISYIAFLSDVHRKPNNSPSVVVADPVVNYIIIEKASGRFTSLTNVTMMAFADSYYELPPPEVVSGHCKPD